MAFTIDVDENKWSKVVLETLLIDRTTNKNIVWGTDDYKLLGENYESHSQILYSLVTGKNSNIIQPRVIKSKKEQENRVKKKAEVFTPSWICNIQNNIVDSVWFGMKNVFNIEKEKSWEVNPSKIIFPKNKDKTWKKYIDEKRIEITCGEAPYLVSRYDSVSGKPICIYNRIGILDRKMRVVNENTTTEEEWLKWAERAFQSVYAFEFQGDNLLIARENLLASYSEYMLEKFQREPTEKELLNIAKIISWNLWQMDGLTFTVPFQTKIEDNRQMTLFIEPKSKEKSLCIIRDWRVKKNIIFQELVKRGEI